MDRSQSLNAPPYFDGSNYAFWKVRMRAFLCSIDETIWDAVDVGWTRLEAAKFTWDKAALAAINANSKALNAIFCDVSPDEFHRISHITIAKEAWQILEITYEGTKKVKDTKLHMLTTQFEELKMSEDESFNSFYSKLNKVVIGKFNLGENTKLDSIGIVEESDDEEDEGIVGLQETYNSLLEKTGEYAKVAKATIKKMKRAEEDYRSLLVRYKETKCEMETLNGELTEVYSKIKFLELKVVQANSYG